MRRKPRGMAKMRVDIKVLVENQRYWQPNKMLDNYWLGADSKPGRVSQMKYGGHECQGGQVDCLCQHQDHGGRGTRGGREGSRRGNGGGQAQLLHEPKVVVEAVTWERVQQAATMDPVMQELGRLLEEGFPETRNEMGDSVREFFKFCNNLSMAQGVVLYKDRVVVPMVLRREILEGLHAGHQGVVSMRARAANCVFWPEIDQAIQYVRNRCRTCDYIAPS